MILISLLLIALVNLLGVVVGYWLPDLNAEIPLALNLVLALVAGGLYFQQHKKEQAQHAQALAEQQEALKLFKQDELGWLDRLPDFLCLKDSQGRWLRASPVFLAEFNLQGTDYIDKTDEQLAQYPYSNARQLKFSSIQDKSAWHLGQPVKETKTVVLPDGSDSMLEITRTPVFDAQQNRTKLILTGRFIDKQKQQEGSRLAYIMQTCHLNILFLDADYRITQVNAKFSQLTGYVLSDIRLKPVSVLVNGVFNLAHKDFIKTDTGRYWSGEVMCRKKDTQLVPVKLDITEVNEGEKGIGYFATIQDISQQRQTEQRVKQIVHYDELTGLANRTMFFERLSRFLSEAKRLSVHMVVLYINLDHFKKVNAALGQDAGNLALKEVARRLLTLVGKQDVVARLNADEFAVLSMNEKSHEQAVYSASIIAGGILQKLAEKCYIGGQDIFISASIGIAIYPEDGITVENLLKNADFAMHEAKRLGRNNYQYYRRDHGDAKQDRLSVETGLRRAISNNELQLYYQPQYYTDSRKIFGAEVLIRWFPKLGGVEKMIPPDKFIGIAEESGLIIEMGAWIMRMACLQLKNWLTQGYDLQQISVNVSPRQFADPNFLSTVENSLREAQLNAGCLELEITESILAGDTKQIELQLHRLKKSGVKIALDDFGTGYSSLSYLKHFPIDVLKIDQAFIRDMTAESKDARLASAIIEMGHSMGQKVIAEGVETEEQLAYLKYRGCDIIQGYLFSAPLPTQKMTSLLIAESKNALELEPIDSYGPNF